jgi:hypothetical protein
MSYFVDVVMTHVTHFADVITIYITHFADVIMTHVTHFAHVIMTHVTHFAHVCSTILIATTAHERVLGRCNCAWKLRLQARLSKVMTLSMLHLSRHLTL